MNMFERSLGLPSRPVSLPDFLDPPLNEVVMGVQFVTPKGYHQIYAGKVWELYRDNFPIAEEQPPLPPTFETFGLPQGQQMPFRLFAGAPQNRFWFVSEKKDHLIQFQNDRLLHNWRKSGVEESNYPRFERVIDDFEKELRLLNGLMREIGGSDLSINQCEISYINHVRAEKGKVLVSDEWFRIFNSKAFGADDVTMTLRRAVHDDKGVPKGRLICEISSAVDSSEESVLVATLTARGAPASTKIEDALDFIRLGRTLIVDTFAEVTTEAAHKVWGRKK
jgi:uncharacterized protein (TIGR04255 family)